MFGEYSYTLHMCISLRNYEVINEHMDIANLSQKFGYYSVIAYKLLLLIFFFAKTFIGDKFRNMNQYV